MHARVFFFDARNFTVTRSCHAEGGRAWIAWRIPGFPHPRIDLTPAVSAFLLAVVEARRPIQGQR